MIRQTYDLDVDALYIDLSEGQVSRTTEVDRGTLVDLDEAGAVLGIEVINPRRAWPLEEILRRFAVSAGDASELRAYFSPRRPMGQPQHQSASGLVSISV